MLYQQQRRYVENGTNTLRINVSMCAETRSPRRPVILSASFTSPWKILVRLDVDHNLPVPEDNSEGLEFCGSATPGPT